MNVSGFWNYMNFFRLFKIWKYPFYALQQLSNILKDPEASSNDKYVALEFLKNANIAAGMVLPGCQDTGTAIIMGRLKQ